jgi:hypothetical protein
MPELTRQKITFGEMRRWRCFSFEPLRARPDVSLRITQVLNPHTYQKAPLPPGGAFAFQMPKQNLPGVKARSPLIARMAIACGLVGRASMAHARPHPQARQ